MTEIPIQNLYYLLCYAWDRLEQRDLVSISDLDFHEQIDLLALVLATGTARLLRLGLDKGYIAVNEESSTIRGRIDFNTSTKRFLFHKARAQCWYDELQADVLHNRVLKSTLVYLAKVDRLDDSLRKRLIHLAARMGGVGVEPLTSQVFSRIQLHSNSGLYAFLIQVCDLAYHATLVDEKSGEVRFRDFLRDESRMAKLFESFLLNFYSQEAPAYTVKSERIYWQAMAVAGDDDLAFLPSMLTDVSLRCPGRTIIMDAKYYKGTLQEHHGHQSVNSANLYQLFAYLKNLEANEGQDAQAEGILVYPTVNQSVDVSYNIQGHKVRVFTVDLMRNWKDIEDQLLSLVA